MLHTQFLYLISKKYICCENQLEHDLNLDVLSCKDNAADTTLSRVLRNMFEFDGGYVMLEKIGN